MQSEPSYWSTLKLRLHSMRAGFALDCATSAPHGGKVLHAIGFCAG